MIIETDRVRNQARMDATTAAPPALVGFTDARDVRLVDVFLRAARTLEAAVAAREIGVRPTVVHRWRASGGEPLDDDVRAGILAFLVRWSMRQELRETGAR